MRFTIFTPVYNRGNIIGELYKSLKLQSFQDFEWIVIDDGSTDNTKDELEEILKENNFFPITYLKTENGGKHRAINRALPMANGELFFIVDSDDVLPHNALERINAIEQSIPKEEKQSFIGVCGLIGDKNGEEIGATFEGTYLDITSLERVSNKIAGDKAEVFYTDILKSYRFPEFEGENFITEDVLWDRIALDGYKLRFFNEIVYTSEYLSDGLTAKGKELHYKNPQGYGLYLSQCIQHGKLKGLRKWEELYMYDHNLRKKIGFKKVAKYLHFNSLRLRMRLFGMKLFYRFYER